MGFFKHLWKGIKGAVGDITDIFKGKINPWGIAELASLALPGSTLAVVALDTTIKTIESYIPGPPEKVRFLTYITSLTAQSYLQVSAECTNVVTSQQLMEIDCQPDYSAGKFYEENPQCQFCQLQALANVNSQIELERRIWQRQPGNVHVRMSMNDMFEGLMDSLEDCRTYCKACNFVGNSQYASVNAVVGCQLNAQTLQRWRKLVTGKLTSMLHQRKDVLDSFIESLGNSDADKTVLTIVQNLEQDLNFQMASVVHASINVDQALRIRQKGIGPVLFQGNDQQNVITRSTVSLLKANFGGNLLTDSQWNTFSNTWVDKSTIDSVGQTLVTTATTFSDLISSTVGALVFGVMMILGLLTVGLVVLVAIREHKHHKAMMAARK